MGGVDSPEPERQPAVAVGGIARSSEACRGSSPKTKAFAAIRERPTRRDFPTRFCTLRIRRFSFQRDHFQPQNANSLGDSRYTWVEVDSSKAWPAPFVQMVNGKDFYLHWEDDKGCLRVDAGGQDFLLGDATNTWRVTRK